MNACVDVDYRGQLAVAACILFDDWKAGTEAARFKASVSPVAPYVPGQFYRRELPCLLRVLEKVQTPLETIIVGGYIWLGNETKPGLGAHLYEALSRRSSVIGVAKNKFIGGDPATKVFRGTSDRPLFVSAVGIELEKAATYIEKMHGHFRIPTLLKLADRLSRTASDASNPGW